MRLVDLIPDVDVLRALEPDELGLRMLPVLASMRGFISLGRVINEWVGNGPHPGEYPRKEQVWVEEAVREAWAWREGSALVIPAQDGYSLADRKLTRRARQLANESDARKVFAARRIPKEILHLRIREDVWALYHRGKYDTAVFESMKAVEVAVREAAHLTPKDIGIGLMRKAFDIETGLLTNMSAEKAERQARSDMFAGAIGSYKNPHSHRNVALEDPNEAAEIVMLANHLLRIVDACRPSGDNA